MQVSDKINYIDRFAETIIHHIQVSESMELSEKSRAGIYDQLNKVSLYCDERSDRIERERYREKYNELRDYLVYMKPKGYADVVRAMSQLDSGDNIWN